MKEGSLLIFSILDLEWQVCMLNVTRRQLAYLISFGGRQILSHCTKQSITGAGFLGLNLTPLSLCHHLFSWDVCYAKCAAENAHYRVWPAVSDNCNISKLLQVFVM